MILSRAAVEAPSSASHYFVLGLRERVRGPLAGSPMALDVCYPVIAKTWARRVPKKKAEEQQDEDKKQFVLKCCGDRDCGVPGRRADAGRCAAGCAGHNWRQ